MGGMERERLSPNIVCKHKYEWLNGQDTEEHMLYPYVSTIT